jgi:hypothetical protein
MKNDPVLEESTSGADRRSNVPTQIIRKYPKITLLHPQRKLTVEDESPMPTGFENRLGKDLPVSPDTR